MKQKRHNIAFSLKRVAQNHPNQTAVTESHTSTSISFQELDNESSRIASGLNQYGFKKGDRVRVAIRKPIFEKGFRQTFSDEIYKVESVIRSRGLCWYMVTDLAGNNKQKAYFHQLQLVKRTNDHDSS